MTSELSYRERRMLELKAKRETRAGEYGPSYRLTIPDHITTYLEQNGLVARWINDDGRGRIYDKTERDTWDFLTNEEVASDPRNANPDTSRITRRVGTKEDGSAMLTYLCVKPKDWYTADAVRRAKPHNEMMAQIRNRPVKTAADEDLSDEEETAYIPKEVKLRAKGVRRA